MNENTPQDSAEMQIHILENKKFELENSIDKLLEKNALEKLSSIAQSLKETAETSPEVNAKRAELDKALATVYKLFAEYATTCHHLRKLQKADFASLREIAKKLQQEGTTHEP